MELFEVYDGKASVQAVREFFMRDDPDHPRNYWRIKRRYEAMFGLGGQSGDVTGVRGSGGNHTEDKLLDGNVYGRALKAIERGLRGCTHQSQEILIARYLSPEDEREKVWHLSNRLGLTGSDRYQRADYQACYEFADAMDVITPQYRVSEVIPQFLRKKERKGNETGMMNG